MDQDDDLLIFDDEDQPEASQGEVEGWNVLVVDDDPEIHTVTQFALNSFTYCGKPLKLHSAYTAAEARSLLSSETEFTIALVDVVMESDEAGLELVQWIRTERKNDHIRIVLRTGQPGKNPDRDVVARYSINDYKEKTELTANKLYTLMYACLRNYCEIEALSKKNEALEKVLSACQKTVSSKTVDEFSDAILNIFCEFSGLGCHTGELNGVDGFVIFEKKGKPIHISQQSGFYVSVSGDIDSLFNAINVRRSLLDRTWSKGGLVFEAQYVIGSLCSKSNDRLFVCVELSDAERVNFDESAARQYWSSLDYIFENLLISDEWSIRDF